MNTNYFIYIASIISMLLSLQCTITTPFPPLGGVPIKIGQQEPHYPDYTMQILRSMKQEFIEAGKYSIEMKSLGGNQFTVTSIAWYFNTFRNHGTLDIKYESQWEKKFPTVPYPGEGEKFIFLGGETTPEQLGNILYGMTGRKLGLSPRLIYQGAGFAAGARGNVLNDESLYYGDSKEDYESVTRGIQYVNNNLCVDLDITKIPKQIQELLGGFT